MSNDDDGGSNEDGRVTSWILWRGGWRSADRWLRSPLRLTFPHRIIILRSHYQFSQNYISHSQSLQKCGSVSQSQRLFLLLPLWCPPATSWISTLLTLTKYVYLPGKYWQECDSWYFGIDYWTRQGCPCRIVSLDGYCITKECLLIIDLATHREFSQNAV